MPPLPPSNHRANAIEYVKDHTDVFVDAYYDQLKYVGKLLDKLTPVDAEMCPGHTFESDLLLLEKEHGIKRDVVAAKWKTLIDLYPFITGKPYYVVVYEEIGFAVISDYALKNIVVS